LGRSATKKTVHLDIIKVLLPTDAQENCFKRSIKVYIKTAPTCFGVITIIRERTIRACQSYNVKNSQLKYIDVVNLVVWLHLLSGLQ
jgi:hypothetical protein